MNSRLESLIKRGYSLDEVKELSNFTIEDLEYASKSAFEHISRNCYKVDDPKAIFIGGQPGCGKTVMSMQLKNKIKNVIEIGIDNYRMYHPNYLKIEKCIRNHWKDKKETINDTPGNDIADFTHEFAGAMTDKLIELGENSSYNMILEWGMRDPVAPLKCMEELKGKGYNNTVLFVLTYKELSYEACNIRFNIMKNSRHIIRKVPKDFHDLAIKTLPDSINTIYNDGYSEKIIDYMSLKTRDGKEIWNDSSKELPGMIFDKYVNNNIISINNNNNLAIKTVKNEMIGLHI